MESLVSVILAAGKGKRMKSAKLKVFHKVMGKTVLERAFDACRLKKSSVICVIPDGQEEVFKKVLPENGVIRRGHIKDNLNNFYNK